MNENEIIINGVDVSECEFISTDEFSSVCKLLNCDCGSFKAKNCYYKQLQRIEVDYEKLAKNNKVLHKTLKKIEEIADTCDIPPCGNFMETWTCKKRCTDETSNNGKSCMYRGLLKILEKIKEVENGF